MIRVEESEEATGGAFYWGESIIRDLEVINKAIKNNRWEDFVKLDKKNPICYSCNVETVHHKFNTFNFYACPTCKEEIDSTGMSTKKKADLRKSDKHRISYEHPITDTLPYTIGPGNIYPSKK